MEKLRSDCGMEHGRDARVAPGVSASVPETGDDEVLPDAPRFEEAPKDSLSSPPAPALFSVEPVPLTRYCPHVTKEACMEARGAQRCCEDVHFRRIKHPQTAREPNADCHFLQLCRFSTTTCRFQHWEIDDVLAAAGSRPTAPPLRFCAAAAARVPERLRAIPEPQWICADLSPAGLDLATLGEFGVVMMDPPVRQHPFTSQHSNHRLLGSMTTLPDPPSPRHPQVGHRHRCPLRHAHRLAAPRAERRQPADGRVLAPVGHGTRDGARPATLDRLGLRARIRALLDKA